MEELERKKLLIDFIEHNSVENILYPVDEKIKTDDLPQDLLTSEIWNGFIGKLDVIRDLLEFPAVPVEKLILEISDKLGFDREERAIAQKVAGDVKFISFRNPKWQLCDLADELLGSRSMYNYFAGLVWDLKGYEPSPGIVSLSTCHKSKGLEWDVVFIAGLSYSDFPVYLTDRFAGEYWFLKQQYKNPQALIKADLERVISGNSSIDSFQAARIETISERARLLYVGITRAEERLYLTAAFERTMFGSTTYNTVSQFVREIPKDLLVKV
jgi:DNA helicase-2/ATP-dependent DNA helicase PcrA